MAKILVVDDEQEWLEILQLLFSRKGWEVHTACSGEDDPEIRRV